MQTVILCGGKSLRFNSSEPKFLIDIHGKPLLCWIMDSYMYYGHTDFILALGGNYEITKSKNLQGYSITYGETSEDCNTGGHLLDLVDILDDEFMLTYADGIGPINLPSLINLHKQGGYALTVTGVPFRTNFGIMTSKNNTLEAFNEKDVIQDKFISGGYFIASKEIIKYISSHTTSLENEVIPQLVRERKVGMFAHYDYWQCMDTQKDYIELCEHLKDGLLYPGGARIGNR